MTERAFDKQNWQQRNIESFGPKFRIDMCNPQMGLNGTEVYTLYSVTDNNDISLTGLSEGGMYHLYNDQSIEIIAGQKSSSNGVDILISSRNGDICIQAEKNGKVRIRAQNIMIDADEDVDIKAGRNITLQSGSGRVVVKTNKFDCDALDGNLAPDITNWGVQVFSGSFVGEDIIKDIFVKKAASIIGL